MSKLKSIAIICFAVNTILVSQYKITDKDNRSSMGWDLSVGIGYNNVSIPGAFTGIDADGGSSFNGRIGFYYLVNDLLKLKFGFQKWSKIYIEYDDIHDNTLGDGLLTIESEFSYYGIYLEILKEGTVGFFGGGLEFSVSKDLSISSISAFDDEAPPDFVKQAEDIFKQRIFHQADVYFIAGLFIVNNEKLLFSPYVRLGVPTISLYDTGSTASIAAFYFSAGLNAEISF
ncbi:MAG: hypothetical protein KDD94_00740 [Calditrichaeota bacterium]|nr:hypothetical protein [Calditrichota bacterium]